MKFRCRAALLLIVLVFSHCCSKEMRAAAFLLSTTTTRNIHERIAQQEALRPSNGMGRPMTPSAIPFFPTRFNNNAPSVDCSFYQHGRRHHYYSEMTRMLVMLTRDADFVEMIVGGERYEMIALPDSMVDTTLFVGNLCDFVTDEILSDLFQAASTLRSVPACVARKPDMTSMNYGFVTFPTVEEKEAAIIQFHGYELNGRTIKVEQIRDIPGRNRVRVPEKIVSYAVGTAKKTRDGSTSTLRRISRDDVERLSRGQPSKRKGCGSRGIPHRLNEQDRGGFARAARNGFVSLEGTGYRRSRKSSPLANIHRQWCDARDKPQIILFKAVGGRPIDQIVVDLSPLRIGALFPEQAQADEFLTKWKAEILVAAENAGMVLKSSGGTKEYDEDDHVDDRENAVRNEFVVTMDSNKAWAAEPIWRLPVVSMGVFEGERAKAKAMARELATVWGVREEQAYGGTKNGREAGARKGGKTKMKGLNLHRRKRRRRNKDVWGLD